MVITAYAILFGGFLLARGRLADILAAADLHPRHAVLHPGLDLSCSRWSSSSAHFFRGIQGLGGALFSRGRALDP